MKFEKYREWLKDYDPLAAQELDYLDTLDLEPIIRNNIDSPVWKIRELIAEQYEEDYLEKYSNDEELFNSLPEDEFVDYINWRYGIRYHEEVTYYFN